MGGWVSVDCGYEGGGGLVYLLCGFRDEHVSDVVDVVSTNSEDYEHAHELAAQEPECWDRSPAGVAGHLGEQWSKLHEGEIDAWGYIYINPLGFFSQLHIGAFFVRQQQLKHFIPGISLLRPGQRNVLAVISVVTSDKLCFYHA